MMMFAVLAVALLALFAPQTCLWLSASWTSYLLAVVMFGMGLTLKLSDFTIIAKRPKDAIIGCCAQFVIMPAVAFALGKLFHLEPALLVGVALVGACPGGTASNVITFLSRGDLPLSIAITGLSTALAPLLTPAITYLLLRETITVDCVIMFKMIAMVVVVPLTLGFLFNRYCQSASSRIAKAAPIISVTAICLIVATIFSHNASEIRSSSALVFAVVILHNLFGYLFGFGVARLSGMSAAKVKALTIEVGMQNSGLAATLANNVFASMPMAATPGAIFSVWHNISGAFLSEIFKRWNPPEPS